MFKCGNSIAKLSGVAVLALFAIGTTQADALLIWNGVTPAPNDSTSECRSRTSRTRSASWPPS